MRRDKGEHFQTEAVKLQEGTCYLENSNKVNAHFKKNKVEMNQSSVLPYKKKVHRDYELEQKQWRHHALLF